METPPEQRRPGSSPRGGPTSRRAPCTRWWVEPAVTFTLLVAWLAYALVGPLAITTSGSTTTSRRSPPCLSASCVPESATSGRGSESSPPFVPLGLLVLPFLLEFRLTCYYRKAYYRSFWLSPSGVRRRGAAWGTGETRFPLILQNAHRYFFYAAIVVSLINTYDVIRAFHGEDGGFSIGLGTIIMLVNVVLLWALTVSYPPAGTWSAAGCGTSPSIRPATGCGLRCRSSTLAMELAWTTLATLLVTDAYIGLVSAGVLTDLRLVN